MPPTTAFHRRARSLGASSQTPPSFASAEAISYLGIDMQYRMKPCIETGFSVTYSPMYHAGRSLSSAHLTRVSCTTVYVPYMYLTKKRQVVQHYIIVLS